MKTPSKASMYQMKDTVRARHGYVVNPARCLITGKELAQITDGPNVVAVAERKDLAQFFEQDEKGEVYYHEIFTTVKGNRFLFWKDFDLKDIGYLAELPTVDAEKEGESDAGNALP